MEICCKCALFFSLLLLTKVVIFIFVIIVIVPLVIKDKKLEALANHSVVKEFFFYGLISTLSFWGVQPLFCIYKAQEDSSCPVLKFITPLVHNKKNYPLDL